MSNHNRAKLTSTELASLWAQYSTDSLAICMFTHFLLHVKDEDIKQLIANALAISQNHIHMITTFMENERYPRPMGFSKNDLTIDAPRLFEDVFYPHYIKQMARFGLTAYSQALTLSFRKDIRSFYTSCIESSTKLDNDVTELLLSKGLLVRSPYIPPDEKVEFVHKQDYLGSIFGDGKRTLNAVEVSHLYSNTQTNIVGKTLITAFSQIANLTVIRDFFLRGKEIADKHIKVFTSLLQESDLPTPTTLGQNITRSSTSPFSDKLMLFHVTTLIAGGIGNYGASMSASLRLDLAVDYAKLTAEIGLYAEDGANLLIDNGWMEEPPQSPNRTAMALSR